MRVTVAVDVKVGVTVDVEVGVSVGVTVSVGVAVSVGVTVGVIVGVSVAVSDGERSTTGVSVRTAREGSTGSIGVSGTLLIYGVGPCSSGGACGKKQAVDNTIAITNITTARRFRMVHFLLYTFKPSLPCAV